MKKFFEEFKQFALRGNMLDMAVAMMIGAAFTALVKSLSDNLITPILKIVTGSEVYTKADFLSFGAGFVSAFFNFLLMALILFLIVKGINKLMFIGKKKEEAAPTKKKCPYCLSEIPIEATRCAFCTSVLEENKK